MKNDSIPLLNMKGPKRKNSNGGIMDNDDGERNVGVHYMNRYSGRFENKTGFLRKIFLGISVSVIGITSIFVVLFMINIFSGNEDENVLSDSRDANQNNLNVPDGKLLAPLLTERVVDTPSHLKVQEFITNHFSSLNWDVEIDRFKDNTPYGEKNFSNYIFTKNKNSKRRIVLAAHYDSKYFDNDVFIGATDSAVPCAILLDIAESLNDKLERQIEKLGNNKEDIQNSTTLQMIFFDGEEAFKDWTDSDSLYGSRHLANKWEKETLESTDITKLESIEVLILLDLLGTKNPNFKNYYKKTEKYFNMLAEVEELLYKNNLISTAENQNNNEKGKTKAMFNYFSKSNGITQSNNIFIDDDHRPFLYKNVPILHIIPSPFPNVWHKINDDATSLDEDTIKDLSIIFKQFISVQLNLNE